MKSRPAKGSDSKKHLDSESEYYKEFIGPKDNYDLFSTVQFNLLTFLGLREHHFLLDIGCGSLRAGRLFIPYLLPGRYFGIEPEQWLIDEGIRKQIGEDMVRIKEPVFSNDKDFTLSCFNQKFDFIMAYSIFSHATQSQITKCLSEVKKVMKPTTIFAATFVEGKENHTGDKWTLWATYSLDHMKKMIEEQGLCCKIFDWPSPDLQKWMLIVSPEFEDKISDLNDTAELLKLKNELNFCRERLLKIEDNTVVKIGLKVKRFIKLLGFIINRSKRNSE